MIFPNIEIKAVFFRVDKFDCEASVFFVRVIIIRLVIRQGINNFFGFGQAKKSFLQYWKGKEID